MTLDGLDIMASLGKLCHAVQKNKVECCLQSSWYWIATISLEPLQKDIFMVAKLFFLLFLPSLRRIDGNGEMCEMAKVVLGLCTM